MRASDHALLMQLAWLLIAWRQPNRYARVRAIARADAWRSTYGKDLP